jgi:electron transfer flavoprotein beta subunit
MRQRNGAKRVARAQGKTPNVLLLILVWSTGRGGKRSAVRVEGSEPDRPGEWEMDDKHKAERMELLVLVKQVAVPEDPVTEEMNRFDEYALEEALTIRERVPGSRVHAMTLGPARAARVVKRALGMGADAGIHVRTPDTEEACSALTASRAAAVLRQRRFDLILTGILSQDRMEGQVGPILAELLGLPCAVGVLAVALESSQQRVRVEREMEGGCRQVLSMALPAVVAVQAGINRPRYPSLSNVLAASKRPVLTLEARDLPGVPGGGRLLGQGLFPPVKTRAGVVLTGSPGAKAGDLFKRLRARGVI